MIFAGLAWQMENILIFMRVEDIYAIFGNALDNAITAVMKVTDPDKRVVSTKLIIQSDLMVIQVQNYYEGKLQFEKRSSAYN